MIVEVSNIVSGLVSEMDKTITGVNFSYKVATFCVTKWARKGKTIRRVTDGEEWFVEQVVGDESITASYMGNTFPEPIFEGVFELNNPFFISGTKLATNREWTIAGKDVTKKTPIIWLLETIRERVYGRGSSLELETELRMFFLDETNIVNFYTEDHRREVVYPMQQLVREFVRTVEADKRFKTLEDYSMKTFSRFGVEKDNGVFQNVLDANLSGVELNITLTKYKENCKC
tara:strand:+ start:547 stop:1239 length:693 start_codon:yes stop_codon:yes gene_type:complete